jgi:hypothetical protein
MKKTSVIALCLVALIVGITVGYRVGLRSALHKIGDEMTRDQLVDAQNAIELEARGYLRSLRALDAGGAEDIANLRKRALLSLRIYVSGVEDLRRLGYDWTPNREIYSNANAYLTAHPREK